MTNDTSLEADSSWGLATGDWQLIDPMEAAC